MSKKSIFRGILVSLAVPLLVYLVIEGVPLILDKSKPEQQDFQYHDTYFVATHIEPILYPVLAVVGFVFYAIVTSVVRYKKRR